MKIWLFLPILSFFYFPIISSSLYQKGTMSLHFTSRSGWKNPCPGHPWKISSSWKTLMWVARTHTRVNHAPWKVCRYLDAQLTSFAFLPQVWNQLFLFEILCVEWTQKWQSLINSMVESWLAKVSYGYFTSSRGVMLRLLLTPGCSVLSQWVFGWWELKQPAPRWCRGS